MSEWFSIHQPIGELILPNSIKKLIQEFPKVTEHNDVESGQPWLVE